MSAWRTLAFAWAVRLALGVADAGGAESREERTKRESAEISAQIEALHRDYEEGMRRAARAEELERIRLGRAFDAGQPDAGAHRDSGA